MDEKQDIRGCEALARVFTRHSGGGKIVVPQRLYDRLKALGMDMTLVVLQATLPTSKEP